MSHEIEGACTIYTYIYIYIYIYTDLDMQSQIQIYICAHIHIHIYRYVTCRMRSNERALISAQLILASKINRIIDSQNIVNHCYDRTITRLIFVMSIF
jgi:hypothetical protein